MLNLPVDGVATAASSGRGKWQSFTLDLEQTKTIRALSQAERVTVYMVLAAAFKTFLYRYSGQPDFLVGTPVTSRTQPETEPLIGCFSSFSSSAPMMRAVASVPPPAPHGTTTVTGRFG